MSTQALPHSLTPPYFSPASAHAAGTPPSATSSPTSPRPSAAHPATRQLRPPKSPMYVPAVLRPTERPVRSRPAHPPTPPRSAYSSTDSLTTSPPRRPSSHASSTSSSSAGTLLRAPSPSTTPLTTLATLTTLTAPASPLVAIPVPTRAHWKPDQHAATCDAAACGAAFSLILRRHHCRRCGGVFCAAHSTAQVPLDADAEFDARGGWWRACEACGRRWGERVVRELEGQTDPAEAGPRPVRGTPAIDAVTSPRRADSAKVEAGVASGSVPRDWTWSTF